MSQIWGKQRKTETPWVWAKVSHADCGILTGFQTIIVIVVFVPTFTTCALQAGSSTSLPTRINHTGVSADMVRELLAGSDPVAMCRPYRALPDF